MRTGRSELANRHLSLILALGFLQIWTCPSFARSIALLRPRHKHYQSRRFTYIKMDGSGFGADVYEAWRRRTGPTEPSENIVSDRQGLSTSPRPKASQMALSRRTPGNVEAMQPAKTYQNCSGGLRLFSHKVDRIKGFLS